MKIINNIQPQVKPEVTISQGDIVQFNGVKQYYYMVVTVPVNERTNKKSLLLINLGSGNRFTAPLTLSENDAMNLEFSTMPLSRLAELLEEPFKSFKKVRATVSIEEVL